MSSVQVAACDALLNLGYNKKHIRRDIVENNGLSRIYKAMSQHPTVLPLQMQVCKLPCQRLSMKGMQTFSLPHSRSYTVSAY